MAGDEKLGRMPVVERGQLSWLKSDVTPVASGRVLLLHGPDGTLPLGPGHKTNMDHRTRYKTFTLVDTGASEIEFSEEFSTSDKKNRYRITVKATARVADARTFVEKYDDRPIGAPLVDLWRNNISNIVNLSGRDGLGQLRNGMASLQEKIEKQISAGQYIGGGIEVLSCTFYINEDDRTLAFRELAERGPQAAADVGFRYPHLKTEINEWAQTQIVTTKNINQGLIEAAETQRRLLEIKLEAYQKIKDMGIDIDLFSDDILTAVRTTDLLGGPAQSQSTEQQRQIGTGGPETESPGG